MKGSGDEKSTGLEDSTGEEKKPREGRPTRCFEAPPAACVVPPFDRGGEENLASIRSTDKGLEGETASVTASI